MLEICIDNIEDIKICNEYKDIIGRIELNSSLNDGGLTPTLSLLKNARKLCNNNISIISMLRLRAGDFYYTDDEFNVMYEDAIEILKYADGIAFGALNKDDSIDLEKTQKILDLCRKNNKEFVFHRAIDVTKDYFKSIKLLNDIRIDRVLTSGHEKNALLGLKNIKKIIADFEILVGCGINTKNINNFKGYDIHGSFSKKINSSFGTRSEVCKKNLEKLRKSNFFKKSNTLFIHGAGIGNNKDGNSLTEFIDNPILLNFKYNQNLPIIKDIQNLLNIQIYGDDAIQHIINHKFSSDDIKYISGHSVGAYNVLKAFANGIINPKNIFERIYPQKVDLLELGAPRIDEIAKYIDEASKRAEYVLIELIEGDKLELDFDINSLAAIQYGNRSVEYFNEIFKNRTLPKNVFVLKIRKVEHNNDYLDNVLTNHAKLFRKNTTINKEIKRVRMEFIEIIKNKSIHKYMKLKKLKELELEFNHSEKYE
ncbi:copper homeostasis protein CutC [Oceanivirga salmonicida]|uniref:copper homeostasis protein CutC n=1 Tax=Oceanivirga salmonicida TaxID=1769291 RepID=UPI0012E2AF9D|nr:copper homeostasis protein CutC [Oceanivirga salmonicida]